MSASSNKKQGGSPVKNLTYAQLRRIWDEMKPLQLAELLRTTQPGNRWSSSGFRLSGCCPYHNESTPSFHVYLDRGYAKCFGCDTYITNPIKLWAKVREMGLSEALTDLRQLFGLKFLSNSVNAQLKSWERNQLLKRRITALCHDELINAINAPNDPAYAAAQGAVNWLINTRQLPKDTLPTLSMLGIVPPIARVMEALDQEAEVENHKREQEALQRGERVEKFTSLAEEARDYLQAAAGWVGCVLFRLDSAPDVIGRLKIRRPHTPDMIFLADAFEEFMGFFGLGWPMYKGLLGAQQKYVPGIHVVEGEFDALSIMARMVKAGGANFLIVSTGGSSGDRQIDTLREFGFEEVYLLADHPQGAGDKLIETWLPEIKNLRAKVFTGWSQFVGCKDPDDAVLKYGLAYVQKVLLDLKNRAFYMTPQDWVFEQVRPELDAIDESDVRLKVEKAAAKGQLLKNNIECDAFVDTCAKVYNLPGATLKKEIVAKEEDEPAFIIRVASVLGQIFYVIGQQAFEGDRKLYLWYKEKRYVVVVSLADDSSIERELGVALGTSWQLFQDRIGIPHFLEPTEQEARGAYLQKSDKNYRWYLRQALILMAHGAPDYDMAEHMGQGIHVVRGIQGAPPSIYLVNGRDVYLGQFDAHTKVGWTQLEGPSHKGIIFDVGTKHIEESWLPWITQKEDLSRADQLDPKDIYERLFKVIDAGWRFKNHVNTVEFLTAHLMATTVCAAFRRQTIVAFHADTRAGKSKILMGLIGGNDFKRIHVIASAIGLPKYTAAGIKQSMDNCTRPLCLDEFEDDGSGDKKSRDIVDVLETFRGLTGENNTITQGSRHGEKKRYKLNFFLFIAAINKARKVQDANRMVTVQMERLDNRPDPVQILAQEFGLTYMEDLKRDLSIALLPRIAAIQQAYEEIETEYGKPGAKPASVDTRIFEAIYPALTVLKVMGLDYHAFVSRFCEANKETLAASAGHTDSMALFDWICQSPKLKARVGDKGDRNEVSLLTMLALPETRSDINLSGSGLYFDATSEILVVNWTTAIQTVLSGHARYGRETNVMNLRELANRAPHALKPEELEKSGALGRLKGCGLLAIPVTHLTGYRVSHIIQGLSGTGATSANDALTQPLESLKDAGNGDV